MNAAEITDKLGLHSLRQRAWVSIIGAHATALANSCCSTSNPHALLLVTVSTRVSNGSATLYERLGITETQGLRGEMRTGRVGGADWICGSLEQ